jgi:hypothetical protein
VKARSALSDTQNVFLCCRTVAISVQALLPAPEPPGVLKADRWASDGPDAGLAREASAAVTRQRARARSAQRSRADQMANRVPPQASTASWSTGSSAAQSARTQDGATRLDAFLSLYVPESACAPTPEVYETARPECSERRRASVTSYRD